MTHNILLIDRDPCFTAEVSKYLRAEGYNVQITHDGESGLKMALSQPLQLIITDIALPKKNGFVLLQTVREKDIQCPIIVLSSKLDDVNQLLSFEVGADAYLTKPCRPHALIAQIRNLLKRVTAHPRQKTKLKISYENITLDKEQHSALLNDKPLVLTNAEFNILYILMKSPNQAFSKKELTEYALGREYTAYDRSIDMHISNLRQKLGNNTQKEPWIKTVRGYGYMFNG